MLASAALVALAACSTPQKVAQIVPPPEPIAPAPKPELGSFGIDLAGRDLATPAAKDWVRHANGAWADRTEIPADRATYGMFHRLDDLSRERTRGIIETAAAAKGAPGTVSQKVGDYYGSFMDEAAIEAKGRAPMQADLDRIAAIRTRDDLARVLGIHVIENGPTPFNLYVNQDEKAPDTYIVVFVQDGLGMPDRDYYLSADAKFADIRAKYLTHAAKMLTLAGVPEAEATARAKAVLDLETGIAKVHWTRVENRDSDKTYNKWLRADFAKKAPGLDWDAYLKAAGIDGQAAFVVSQPSAFAGMAKLAQSQPLAVWRDMLTLHLTKDRAGVLPKAFVDENFAFNGTVLSGQPQIQDRWKRGVNRVNAAMGEAVGQLYVDRYFPPEAKAEADRLVKNIVAAMDTRLANLPWMTPETKVKARAKLASFRSKIGYPEKWRDYSALEVVAGDAYGNDVRAAKFENARNLAKLGQPVDRDEWFMTPMTVNAYANPPMNEIVFPAAILQPPFFDPHADPAVNYGGIGAVIGHEISHHFDDQGRRYDPTGKLTDWWTAEDVKRFQVYADQLAAQYGKLEPLPGQFINGKLALGENIADLAGLLVSYDAYKLSLGGKEAPVLEGLTGDQRFFLGHAQIWRQEYREAAMRQQLVVGPHSPGNFRPYVSRNLDPWVAAFGVKEGDPMFLRPEDRVRIW
jgi:putative endopeptidase